MNKSIKNSFLTIIMAFTCLFSVNLQADESSNKSKGVFAFIGATIAFVSRAIGRDHVSVKGEREMSKLLKGETACAGKDPLSFEEVSNKKSVWERMKGWFGGWFYSRKSSEDFHVEKMKCLNQEGLTCGPHALRNAECLVRWVKSSDGEEKQPVLTEMLNAKEFKRRFDGRDGLNNLYGDELKRLTLDREIFIIDSMIKFGNLVTEEEVALFLRAAKPSGVFGFVFNTGGHWVTYVLEKEEGKVKKVYFANSASGNFDNKIVSKLQEVCELSKTQVDEKIKMRNRDVFFEGMKDKIEAGVALDEKRVNDLAECVYDRDYSVINFDTGETERRKLRWLEKQQLLDKIKEKKLMADDKYSEFELLAKQMNTVQGIAYNSLHESGLGPLLEE